MKNKFASDIKLGERYRDDQTGYEGTATAVYFFQYGCERVTVENYDATRKEIKEQTFDAPRLTHIDSNKRVTVDRTGGPDRSVNAVRGAGVVAR